MKSSTDTHAISIKNGTNAHSSPLTISVSHAGTSYLDVQVVESDSPQIWIAQDVFADNLIDLLNPEFTDNCVIDKSLIA